MNIQFQLEAPLPYLNTSATKGWFFLQYPSGWSYWCIQNEENQILKEGNYTFPQSVLDQWLESDDVLIDHLLEVQPWIVAPVPTPEPTPTPTPDVTPEP